MHTDILENMPDASPGLCNALTELYVQTTVKYLI